MNVTMRGTRWPAQSSDGYGDEGGETMSKKSASAAAEVRTPVRKKPYRTPRLIEYGHVSKLTAGSSGTHTDEGHLANPYGQG
jgi:hypothetical protein